MITALAFTIGLFIGATAGVLMFALVCMSGYQDDLQERHP